MKFSKILRRLFGHRQERPQAVEQIERISEAQNNNNPVQREDDKPEEQQLEQDSSSYNDTTVNMSMFNKKFFRVWSVAF